MHRAEIDTMSGVMQWSWCFFHAMTQLLAISIGVVEPKRPAELWGFFISIMLGATLYAIFVASLTAVFTELGASGREYRQKMDQLHQFMAHSHMPEELRLKLKTYFELCFPDKKMFNESQILERLSHPLQSEVAVLKCRDVLSVLSVLDDPDLSRTIAIGLARVVFIDGDHVIRAGEHGQGMFFIQAGQVEVSVKGQAETILGPTSFFGEMALLEPDGRATGDVFVKGFVETYLLSRAIFSQLVIDFPGFASYIEYIVKLRRGRKSVRFDTSQKAADAKKAWHSCREVMSPVKRKLLKASDARKAGNRLRHEVQQLKAGDESFGSSFSGKGGDGEAQPHASSDKSQRWLRAAARAVSSADFPELPAGIEEEARPKGTRSDDPMSA